MLILAIHFDFVYAPTTYSHCILFVYLRISHYFSATIMAKPTVSHIVCFEFFPQFFVVRFFGITLTVFLYFLFEYNLNTPYNSCIHQILDRICVYCICRVHLSLQGPISNRTHIFFLLLVLIGRGNFTFIYQFLNNFRRNPIRTINDCYQMRIFSMIFHFIGGVNQFT